MHKYGYLVLLLTLFLLRATISTTAAHLCGEWDIGGLGMGPPSSPGRKKRHQLQSGVSHLSIGEPRSDWQSNFTEESLRFPAWASTQRNRDAVRPGDCGPWSPIRQRSPPEQDWRIPLARFWLYLQLSALPSLQLRCALLSGPDWPADHQGGGEQAQGPHALHLYRPRSQRGLPCQRCRGVAQCVCKRHHQPSRWGGAV